MNTTAARVARQLSRNRCLATTNTRSVTNIGSWITSNENKSSSLSLSPLSSPSILQLPHTTPQNHRFFASDSGGGSDDREESSPIPPVVDLDSNSNAETYDPFEITKTFEDTSYYFPPAQESDPQFLAQKYEGLTNEELLDNTTIEAVKDPHTGVTHTWESLMHSPPIRDKNAALPKGTLVGTVVSTKMQKTVNVAVDRYKVHPKYRKRIRYTRKFMAHDEHEVASDGDLVLIVPSQRISKKKHFVLREILKAKGQL